MSTSNLVRAKHKNGAEQDIPAHWLDDATSPFPGSWTAVKVPEQATVEQVQPPIAGDSDAVADPEPRPVRRQKEN